MKFPLFKLLCLVFLLSIFKSFAQSSGMPAYNHLSLQLQVGTQGVGGDLRYGSDKRFSARAGVSFIPVKVNNVFSFSGFDGSTNASVKFSNVHLLADFVPFKQARGFRLVGGAAYLYHAQGGMEFLPTGDYKFGNYTVTADDLGKLNMDISWKGVAPYLGIGLFKSFPNRLFNINLDLGTYYLSQPSSHIVGTNLLSDNNQLEPQLNSNIKSYRWLPVLQVNFNFKLQ
ncbi:hypothetical protein [Mucilaginibacter lacusdianchii]|uniref:hypothetical protein n=1 Tax=Mucilaginibacter lacusdianchii TaxID=2684211 RepID=UPI001E577F7E|nr:hypothetical protein [Mucilaginibacter sp. JXJ CY 39]